MILNINSYVLNLHILAHIKFLQIQTIKIIAIGFHENHVCKCKSMQIIANQYTMQINVSSINSSKHNTIVGFP